MTLRERFKRSLRKITGRPQKQPGLPPAAEPARTTPEDPSATSRQHVQQDNSSATTPTPPTAASTSIIPEEPSAMGGNHIQQQQSDSCSATPPAANILWNRAYDDLAKENPDLVQKYEELLAKEQMANSATDEMTPPHDPDTRTDRSRLLDTVIQLGLQRMKDNKTTINIAGQKIVLEDQIAKAANILVWGSDFIGTAVKISPEASLVWAGVSLILPLLTNATTAAEANEDGFAYVTSRMRYYVALEPMLHRLGQNASVDEALMSKATDHLVDLYRAILDFQISSVLRFFRNRFKVYVRDTVTSKDWKQTLLDIKTREQTVNEVIGQINGLTAREELASLNETSKELRSGLDYCLSVAMQQLDVAKQQLAAQKDAEQTRLLAEQRKERQSCLQLFYLTQNGNGATYDWYKDRVEPRVEGTCKWFLQHDNYRKWLSQESGPLLVSADPGCGKSVLAKYLIDHGLAQQSATICYFFFKDQDQNTICQALCALLHQLFSQKLDLVQHAMELYNRKGKNLVQSEESLWTILRDAVRDPRAGPVTFVIDALDECDESQLRSLITNLKNIFQDQQLADAKFKVLMTSRPYDQVVRKLRSLQDDFPRIHIPGEEEFETISKEINRVIHHRVELLAQEHGLSDRIKSALENKLLAIGHRTYLWVYLVFDYLDKEGFKQTGDGIDAAIQTLPETVNQAYDRMLNRSLKDKTSKTVKTVLSIILAARRPLTLSEMNIALSLDGPGRGRPIDDLDLEQDKAFKTRLRTLCGLFVNIHHDKIYFLHQTAREFLLHSSAPTPVSSDLQWHHSITTRYAQSVLAEICMLYLDRLNSTPAKTFRKDDQHNAFFEYSDRFWGGHFREADFEKGSAMVDFALGLCTPDLTSDSEWASHICEQHRLRPGSSIGVLVASNLELVHVTELLLSRGADIEAKNNNGWTALMCAAESGHEAVVRLLLEKGADIEAKSDTGWTALSYASNFGNEAVSWLLLENGASVEAKGNFGRTVLINAAADGHEDLTRLLLEKGADVEAKDDDDWTALMHAAQEGHDGVLRLLLEKGAGVEAKDDGGWTALILAAPDGHEVVTRLLLEKGAYVEAKDDAGETALMVAAHWGHDGVLRLLLEKGANVEEKDNLGRTALGHATESTTRLLLENAARVKAMDVEG